MNLIFVNHRIFSICAHIYMVILILNDTIVKLYIIGHLVDMGKVTVETHFLWKSSMYCTVCCFTIPWMTAAGVCPESWCMIFMQCSLLYQQLLLVIEYKDAESSMLHTLYMSFLFSHITLKIILLIHKNQYIFHYFFSC